MCDGITEAVRTYTGGSDAMSVDWFAPKVGHTELSEVGIIEGLEQLDAAARDRVLAYAVSRWWPGDDVKGAGQ